MGIFKPLRVGALILSAIYGLSAAIAVMTLIFIAPINIPVWVILVDWVSITPIFIGSFLNIVDIFNTSMSNRWNGIIVFECFYGFNGALLGILLAQKKWVLLLLLLVTLFILFPIIISFAVGH